SVIFFFQAEDGIRDFHVTGVQTCALPILVLAEDVRPRLHLLLDQSHAAPLPLRPADAAGLEAAHSRSPSVAGPLDRRHRIPPVRSEERRVGKECRTRWWLDNEKRKVA